MKAQDLFIGAWALYKDKPYRILGIKTDEDDEYRCELADATSPYNPWVRVKELSPAPLSPEALEKNGFTDCETTPLDLEDGNQFWYLGKEGFISNSDLMVNLFLGGAGFLVRYRNNIGYYGEKAVHLLQRFLLDNEIDKEIVL